MPVSTQAAEAVRKTLDATTSDPTNGVAGLVFTAVDKNGQTLASHASGNIGLDTKNPMTMETVFWIASCTKMITGIACMQLVEQNKLALDDAKLVEQLCPELKGVKVLDESGQLVERKGEITLRMLLAHTAGFSYTFFNTKLRKWTMPAGLEEFSGDQSDILQSPLCNQPGERWEYGVSAS
jgi:CubicO group peptidase (beta-lactamase class C family)